MKDLGDKVPESDKKRVDEAKDALKAAVDKGDTAEIRRKIEALNSVLHEVSSRIYQQAASNPGASANGSANEKAGGEKVVDAEFTVSDEEKSGGR